MKDEGVTSVYILDDAEVYGKGVAANTKAAAEKLGIKIAGKDSWDGKASNYRALASKIKSTGADAVFTGGIIDNNAPQLYKDLQRRDAGRQAVRPRRRGDGGLHQGDPGEGPGADVPDGADACRRTSCRRPASSSTRTTRPSTASRRTRSTRTPCTATRRWRVVLDAIEKGGDDRPAVIEAFFSTKGRESPLGTYDIDPDGDTTLTDYGAYIAEGGKLVFNKVIKAATALGHRTGVDGGGPARPARRRAPDTRTMEPHPSRARPSRARGEVVREFISRFGLIALLLDPAGRLRDPGPAGRRRPHPARHQHQGRPLQRRDLGADRHRLHARLRHHRADQLRPRRRVHDRHLRRLRALRHHRAHGRHRRAPADLRPAADPR